MNRLLVAITEPLGGHRAALGIPEEYLSNIAGCSKGRTVTESLEEYLGTLTKLLGGRVRSPVDPRVGIDFHRHRNYPGLIRWVAQSMGIAIPIEVVIDEDPKRPNQALARTIYETTLKFDLGIGARGENGEVTMWFEAPAETPAIDDPKGLAITFHIWRDVLDDRTFEYLIADVARQFSQVVLSFLGSELKGDGRALDITSMLLGFSDFVGETEMVETPRSLGTRALMYAIPIYGLMARKYDKTPKNVGHLTSDEAAFVRRSMHHK